MSQPVKFMFERRFEDRRRNAFTYKDDEPTVTISAHEAQIAEAQTTAFQHGFDQGQAAARAEETARLAAALEAVTDRMNQMGSAIQEIEEAATVEAIRFARLFAGKLAGSLTGLLPLARLEEAARDILRDMRGTSHLTVRVMPELVAAAREKLSAVAESCGFEGRLAVLATEDLRPGDAMIEWADGGIILDQTNVESRLDAALQHQIAVAFPTPSSKGTA
jgi:flagellar assembly protein FliH